MRRIWYVFIILLCSLNASWSLAAQETLFESVQELDGQPGTSKGADWRLTDFANFALQNDMNTDLYGHKVVSGSVTGGTLTLVLADASTIAVDVSTLLDNTDAQTITTFNLNSSTNILTLTLSGGNTETVDLSGLVGTDGLVDASSDGAVYGRKDGAWVAVEPLKGADDNYVTDAEKTVLGNTSGTNTGDQDLSGKQDTLVSGTNIKTVNSTSILGSGDIAVEGALPTGTEGQMIEYDTNGDPIAITPDEVTFVEPLSYDDTLKEVSIDTTGLGGSPVTFTDTDPTSASANGVYQNTTDFALWTKGTDWLCEVGVGCDPIDTAPPVASNFATDSTGLQYSFTASEASTVDCTKLTATWTDAGTITDFTGTDPPCVSSTPVYSDDTGTIAGAQGFLVDTATNESIAFSGLAIDNSLNETTDSGFTVEETWDFNDGLLTDFTVTQGATPTTAVEISDTDPLEGSHSIVATITSTGKETAYLERALATTTADRQIEFEFSINEGFNGASDGNYNRIFQVYKDASSIVGLSLVRQSNGVIVLYDTIVTKDVPHTVTVKLVTSTSTNDGIEVMLDGVVINTPEYTNAWDTATHLRFGQSPNTNFVAGSTVKIDNIRIGYAE
jgi:hypothetical protein